jgi:hypothetical protein
MDIKAQPTVKCEKCKSIYFDEVHVVKKVSKLLTGAAEDTIVPFPILRCADCKHVNSDMNPLKDEEPIQPPLYL